MAAVLLALVHVAALLPTGATVVETTILSSGVSADRMLVIWVVGIRRECPPGWRDGWGCWDNTRGCHYQGPTRVSLVDTKGSRIINTLSIASSWTGEDAFQLPYEVRAGGPYRSGGRFGRPRLLELKDYNGDGVAAEFALYQTITCSDLLSSLIGYSQKQDRVIQYPIQVTFETYDHQVPSSTTNWAELLFATAPVAPGRWRFAEDHPGSYTNLAAHIHFENEVWYRPATEAFEMTSVESERE